MMTTSGQDGDTPLTRDDVPAVDAVGRSRQVSVRSSDDGVVLQVPPGEVAVLRPDQARALADHLYEQTAVRPRSSATVVPLRRKASPTSRLRTGSGT